MHRHTAFRCAPSGPPRPKRHRRCPRAHFPQASPTRRTRDRSPRCRSTAPSPARRPYGTPHWACLWWQAHNTQAAVVPDIAMALPQICYRYAKPPISQRYRRLEMITFKVFLITTDEPSKIVFYSYIYFAAFSNSIIKSLFFSNVGYLSKRSSYAFSRVL